MSARQTTDKEDDGERTKPPRTFIFRTRLGAAKTRVSIFSMINGFEDFE